MSEISPKEPGDTPSTRLVDKPVDEMSREEYLEWHIEYMKSVPEENIVLISGIPIEVDEEDPDAFYNFVTAFQQLKRQGLE